jgi:hypothetical protein
MVVLAQAGSESIADPRPQPNVGTDSGCLSGLRFEDERSHLLLDLIQRRYAPSRLRLLIFSHRAPLDRRLPT